MGMGFAPTWLRQVTPPPLHKTTLTTGLKLQPSTPCLLNHGTIYVRNRLKTLLVRLCGRMVAVYLSGQRKKRGPNPGPAVCLEWICLRINLLAGRGTIYSLFVLIVPLNASKATLISKCPVSESKALSLSLSRWKNRARSLTKHGTLNRGHIYRFTGLEYYAFACRLSHFHAVFT